MSNVVSGRRTFPPDGPAITRWLRRGHPRATDAALAVTMFTAMALIGSLWHPEEWQRFDHLAYLLTALTCLPLAARRIAPALTLAAVSLAFVGYLALGYTPSLNFYAPLVAFYTLATIRPPRSAAIGASLLGALVFYSGLMAPELPFAVAVIQGIAVPVVVWAIAGVSRRLNLRNRQLAAATEQLRREQELRVEHAVTQERLQIARELHDVLAHHISVISMQAGLARYVFDTDLSTVRSAVHTIDGVSGETLEELRRVLKLLRTTDMSPDTAPVPVETEPAPGLERLHVLVDRVRSVGVDVSLEVTGAVDELPNGLQLTVYRVIQEALTNVIKHAGPCEAAVIVRRDSQRLTTSVTNSGPPKPPPTTHTDGGHGLVGMRERARLYGGILTVGPRPEGGYSVLLTVPWPSSISSLHR